MLCWSRRGWKMRRKERNGKTNRGGEKREKSWGWSKQTGWVTELCQIQHAEISTVITLRCTVYLLTFIMKGFKGSDLCLSSFQVTGSSQWRQNTLNCGDKPSFVLGRRLTAQRRCMTFDLCSCLCASGWSGSWQDASYKLQSGFRFSTQDSIPPSAAQCSEDLCWRRWGITAATKSHQKLQIQNVPHIFIG